MDTVTIIHIYQLELIFNKIKMKCIFKSLELNINEL